MRIWGRRVRHVILGDLVRLNETLPKDKNKTEADKNTIFLSKETPFPGK